MHQGQKPRPGPTPPLLVTRLWLNNCLALHQNQNRNNVQESEKGLKLNLTLLKKKTDRYNYNGPTYSITFSTS